MSSRSLPTTSKLLEAVEERLLAWRIASLVVSSNEGSVMKGRMIQVVYGDSLA
jgi:hypothetical protein